MKEDVIVEGFVPPPHPKGIVLTGAQVRLEPLDADKHGADLHRANSLDTSGTDWVYLPYGPFDSLDDYQHWINSVACGDDPVFFAIITLSDRRAVGVASFLRINPASGSIEVGHIHYSPLLKRTRAASEAMYLMMRWVFENGYRRYEWKCNALNAKSRVAAGRLGFSFEGVFRQADIVKGRNRNTAWFATIDSEWPFLRRCFEAYLSDENFDENHRPRQSLSALTKPGLYKPDSGEFS